jgi:hypothetical protein
VALAAATVLLSACGLPGDGTTRTVDDADVPYHLLDEEASPSVPADDRPVPRRVPVVFWLLEDEHLVPDAALGSCTDPAEQRVQQVLEELAAGPADDARAAGRSSALPSDVELAVLGVDDGTALLDVDPGESVSADRLPLAVGQVVLSVTLTAGVRDVQFLSAGGAVQVPLPGGALTSSAVSADDYAELLPERYQAAGRWPTSVSARIGCA